jgi:uncharacterized protein
MKRPVIFRKRFIPSETVELKDDVLLYRDDSILITRWTTLRPRHDIAGGISLYLIDKGCKISRIHDAFGRFLHYYCDIIHTDYSAENDTYIFTDLLADIIVHRDNRYSVVDLDELAEALKTSLIDTDTMCEALCSTDRLIRCIDNGEFHGYTNMIERYVSL